jgi:hypothetical protein
MMIHAALHWPEMQDKCLWPMAVTHATYIHNRIRRQEIGFSPHKLLLRIHWERKKLQDFYVW